MMLCYSMSPEPVAFRFLGLLREKRFDRGEVLRMTVTGHGDPYRGQVEIEFVRQEDALDALACFEVADIARVTVIRPGLYGPISVDLEQPELVVTHVTGLPPKCMISARVV